MRFRCDYFPYVEPGVDLAIDCMVCGGEGCRACKYTGWLEIMGAGMVHPQVLRNGGLTPTSTAASPSAWARSASPCCATASTTSGCSTATTCASCSSSELVSCS